MQKLPFEIILENSDFVAINKPQGLVINRAESVKNKPLADYMQEYLDIPLVAPSSAKSRDTKEFYSKSGVVHRLDKDTSGVVVIAKNPKSYIKLKDQFMKRKVIKTYSAVVFNNLVPLFEGRGFLKVNLPLARSSKNRHQFSVSNLGREAVSNVYLKTEFNGVKINPTTDFGGTSFTFVSVKPKSGRTHQIRVHLKALNAEILGDRIYCGRKQLKVIQTLDAKLMLHARRLVVLGNTLEASYPRSFVETADKLGFV
jgi:23S rRNA pseudouridine1911/1915/1917 synthase